MHTWILKSGDPLSLVVASDARLCQTDYVNDHIWELVIGSGDPPALALQTTFGLRARSFRIFPRLTLLDETQSDPANFTQPVTIQRFYPNYLQLSCQPFPSINVEIEYWVPESHSVSGRTKLKNISSQACDLQLEWVVLLNPAPGGQRMAQSEAGIAHILSGITSHLAPVFFITGGAHPGDGPYPSLTLNLPLQPEETRQITWVQATLEEVEVSFVLARQVAARDWDAECARIEMTNASQVEIHSGDADWDACFALAQNTACRLFLSSTAQLSAQSFVTTRQPDQGYSIAGNGSDYGHLWNGQSPFESLYLASLLLPSFPSLVKGMLDNFLEVQTQDGTVDLKPGLGGQRTQRLATPLLASLAWRIYQITEDQDYLEKIFPKLLAFLQVWFNPEHDRDGDGIPEWDHSMQSGYDEHPYFSHWQPWAQGIDITTVESPGLCAFLYRECQLLVEIARFVGHEDAIPALQARAEQLRAAIDASWSDEDSCYHYWDRESHHNSSSEYLGECQGASEIMIRRKFKHPVRLLIHVNCSESAPPPVELFIHGTSPSGGHRIEHITPTPGQWLGGIAKITSEKIYTSLEHLEIQGIHNDDRVSVRTVGLDFLDQTLLLPLWAGIPDKVRATALIRQTLLNAKYFWGPFGIRPCTTTPPEAEDTHASNTIHLPFNYLIGEGLVHYGFQSKAAELVSRIMPAIVQSLKQDHAFRSYYDGRSGQGMGEFNTLSGLAPLGLFLDALGIHIVSPKKVRFSGTNPFPWPVTVKYQGLTILRQKSRTMVIFPDGQNCTIRNGKPLRISLE